MGSVFYRMGDFKSQLEWSEKSVKMFLQVRMRTEEGEKRENAK